MIVTKDFPFTPANSSRTLHIYLPDDYYQSQEAYPCMYYFDGQNLFSITKLALEPLGA